MAQPVDFPEKMKTLHAPPGMEDAVGDLHTRTEHGIVWSCWQLDEEEMMEVVTAGGRIWLGVMGGQPPVMVKGIKPEFSDDNDKD